MTNPSQIPPSQNCGVMVDISMIHFEIKKMVDVICGQGLANSIPVDDLAIESLLYEALNHYLSYVISRSHVNIGIDYYLDEYFAEIAPFIKSHPQALNFLGTTFATAAANIAQQLHPAMTKLEYLGQDVHDLQSFPVQPGKLSLYVVEGEGFEGCEDVL